MNWRAWLLIAVLGAAVVVGAFIIPRDDPGDQHLADAARAVLSSTSFRTTYRGRSRGVEDYVQPDRVRTTSELDGHQSATVFIGSGVWADQWCTTATGTRHGYTTQRLSRPISTGGEGWQILVLATQADDAHQLAPHRYAFTISLPVPVAHATKLAMRPFHGVATVRDGVVHAMKLSRDSQSFELRFSRLGTVPPIRPLTGPRFDGRQCSIRLTPVRDPGS